MVCRYVPPKLRQSGRRAEDALKQAVAALQASSGGAGHAQENDAALSEQQQALSASPQRSHSPSSRPQPFFMASPQSRRTHEMDGQGAAEHDSQLQAILGHRPDAPGIGTDLSALLQQAEGSDAAQQLASLPLPAAQPLSQGGLGVQSLPAQGSDDATETRSEASGQDAAIQEMLAAAAASREALASLGPPDDSPRSPGAQQHSQPSHDAEPKDHARCNAGQAVGALEGAQVPAKSSEAHMGATDRNSAPGQADRQATATQASSQPQSNLPSRSHAPKQGRGASSQSSRDRAGGAKGSPTSGRPKKDPDALSGQKSIKSYFMASPRPKA